MKELGSLVRVDSAYTVQRNPDPRMGDTFLLAQSGAGHFNPFTAKGEFD